MSHLIDLHEPVKEKLQHQNTVNNLNLVVLLKLVAILLNLVCNVG